MTGKIITIKLPLLLLAVIIAVTTITSCGSNEEKNEKPFVFLGEGYENGVFRSDNFDKDTIVTPETIAVLYNEYNVETLFNGSYDLIHSKKSYTTSRYLSRLIQMKEGKQVAAKTFYDSEIDANKVLKLRDKLIIGLNSLRVNNYNSTFHQSSHQCRVVVLSDSLTPIVGKRFYSQKGHTYIESLMQISDSTFICSVASGEVEINPYSHYQFKGREDLSIVGSTYISDQYDYAIHNEWMNFSESDWGNDLSDEAIAISRNEKEVSEYDKLRDSTNIEVDLKSQTNHESQGSCKIEEHPCVDLGLSVLWASYNVGASTPEEYGEYYAWGEISTKKEYTEANYKWYDNKKRTEWGYQYQLTKYNSDSYYGRVDNKNKLDDVDDVAIAKWGNGWRMPTYKDWNELREKCSWKWICIGGVYGYRVTSSINNHSIFLPAAGEGGYQGQVGHYWSSTISYSDCAKSIDFNNTGKRLNYYAGWRSSGYSVRPVKTIESAEENTKH